MLHPSVQDQEHCARRSRCVKEKLCVQDTRCVHTACKRRTLQEEATEVLGSLVGALQLLGVCPWLFSGCSKLETPSLGVSCPLPVGPDSRHACSKRPSGREGHPTFARHRVREEITKRDYQKGEHQYTDSVPEGNVRNVEVAVKVQRNGLHQVRRHLLAEPTATFKKFEMAGVGANPAISAAAATLQNLGETDDCCPSVLGGVIETRGLKMK